MSGKAKQNAKAKSARSARKQVNNKRALAKNWRTVGLAQRNTFTKPRFTMSQKNNVLDVSGTDLWAVTDSKGLDNDIFVVVPANPIYWIGTRLAGIASVYQQYKPVTFHIKYVPTCATTTPGLVTLGFLMNGISPDRSDLNVLLANSGGIVSQCYSGQSCSLDTISLLKSYNIRGSMLDESVNPFTFVGTYNDLKTYGTPGFIYITWHYRFYIGSGDQGVETKVIDKIDAQSVTNYNLVHNTNLLSGFGITIGMLKQFALPFLKRVAIFILEKVIAEVKDVHVNANNPGDILSITLPTGTWLSLEPTALIDSYTSECLDSQGNRFYVPDNCRICAYMSGPPIIQNGTPLPIDEANIVRIALANDYNVRYVAVMESDGRTFYIRAESGNVMHEVRFLCNSGRTVIERIGMLWRCAEAGKHADFNLQIGCNGKTINQSYDQLNNGDAYNNVTFSPSLLITQNFKNQMKVDYGLDI